MSETKKTKLCRTCYEEIDERARRCPHCLAWQTTRAFLFGSQFLWLPVLVLAAWFMPVLMARALVGPFFRSGTYVVYDGQIEVTESRMLFGDTKDGPVVFVVGRLKNNSDIGWDDIELQAQFFDESHALVNVEAESHYGRHIMPRGESAFKVRGPADLPRERYARYAVMVTGAVDARRWPW